MRITVDGDPAVQRFEILGIPLTKEYRFRTGTAERHDVAIVKTRPLLVAWMRPQPVQAFVDGALAFLILVSRPIHGDGRAQPRCHQGQPGRPGIGPSQIQSLTRAGWLGAGRQADN